MIYIGYGVFTAFMLYIIFNTLIIWWRKETALAQRAKARAQREFYYSVWAVKDAQTQKEQGE